MSLLALFLTNQVCGCTPLRVFEFPIVLDEIVSHVFDYIIINPGIHEHSIVAVPGGLLPWVEQNLFVAVVGIDCADHAYQRVIEQGRADAMLFDAVAMVIAEEGFKLLNRFAFVVVDVRSCTNPARYGWRGIIGLCLYFALRLPAKTVGIDEGVLDVRWGSMFIGYVGFPRHGVNDVGFAGVDKTLEVVYQARSRFFQNVVWIGVIARIEIERVVDVLLANVVG